jgi:hypothetical protein
MSIFFAILKGPYDTILPWPFSCPVKITLINLQATQPTSDGDVKSGSQARDVVRVFQPNPRPENEPFLGRPTEPRNMSLGK